MKHNDIPELDDLDPSSFANLFNVYDEPKLGNGYITYAINKTFNLLDLNENAEDDANTDLVTKYEVKVGDTWPLISYKFYGDVKLWWLVAKANNIANPTIEPEPTKIIRIINVEFVNTILDAIRNFE